MAKDTWWHIYNWYANKFQILRQEEMQWTVEYVSAATYHMINENTAFIRLLIQ
jgi:hypothetical protein